MIKQTVCKECGSSNIKLLTYAKLSIPYDKYQGKITKELIADEEVDICDFPDIKLNLICADCGHEIEKELDFRSLETRELGTELINRMEELQSFKEDVGRAEFEKSVITLD